MNNQPDGHGFATPEQELLLQAALLQRDAALQAWQQWKMQNNLDQVLDAGTHRLLPLVYHNLRALGVEDPLMGKLSGIYRKEWYKNQMLFHAAAEFLRLFHAAGIETMILNGAALTLAYYKDYGLRPMNDFDVLIPTVKRGPALAILKQAGWNPSQHGWEKLTTSFLDAKHAWGFEDVDRRQFDLHWHLLTNCSDPNADDDFWAEAVPMHVGNVPTRTLNATDQLLTICGHGVELNPVRPVWWIADAMMILKESLSEIEWPRLIFQAEKRHSTFMVHHALTYLRDSFGAAVPSDVLTEISKVQVTDSERKLYNAAIARPTLLGRLPYYWYQHLFIQEVKGETNWARKWISFPRYLQSLQAMNSWQFLAWVISRTSLRIGKAVLGRL